MHNLIRVYSYWAKKNTKCASHVWHCVVYGSTDLSVYIQTTVSGPLSVQTFRMHRKQMESLKLSCSLCLPHALKCI